MAFDKSALGTKIQACIDAVTSSSSVENFTSLAAARNQFCSNFKVSVATTNDLPDIYSDKIPNGQVIFVEDIESLVMSANCCWVGIDRRLLRNDVPDCRIFTWGSNFSGELGDGTSGFGTCKYSPVTTIGGGVNWCRLSASNSAGTTAAIKSDGTLWLWGSNTCGKIGDGTTTARLSPVTVSGGGTTWCQAATTGYSSFAVKTDGTAWSWGCNGASSMLGISVFGTSGNRCVPTQISGSTDLTWCQISGGSLTVAGVKASGTLWVWGQNTCGAWGRSSSSYGSIYNSPVQTCGTGTNWCFVKSSKCFISALKSDGTLWSWGANGSGQLGTGDFSLRLSPVSVIGGGTNWCRLSNGGYHTIGLKTDGTLWAWGSGSVGRVGDGTTNTRTSPVTVAGGGTNWARAAGSNDSSAGVKTDGTLWTWGWNGSGELATGNTTNRSSPGTTVAGGTSWSTVYGLGSAFGAIQVV